MSEQHAFSATEGRAVHRVSAERRGMRRPVLEIDQWTHGRPLSEFVAENGWSSPPPAVGLPACPP